MHHIFFIIVIRSRRQSCHPFVITVATCNISPMVVVDVAALGRRKPETEDLFPRRKRKKETKGGNNLCWLPPSSPLKVHFSFWHKNRKLRFTAKNLLKKDQQDGLFICAFSFFGIGLVVLKGSRLVFKILQILDGRSEERQTEEPVNKAVLQYTDSAPHVASACIVWISFQLLLHFALCN